jgi:membrane-bound inhibitor of C-type lysozyme
MTLKDRILSRRKLAASIAIVAAIAIGGGAYGIVSATASTGPSTATSPFAASGKPGFSGGGSNARSGPAAGGATGTVDTVSASSFTISTPADQKVTIRTASSTTYKSGTNSISASAITKGERVLVLGITDSTTQTITASQVVAQTGAEPASWSAVVAFQRGAPDTAKTVGQIPSSYKQGTGAIVSGATANKATKAALAVYPGGLVDRVVKLSNGDYEVHNIGVNWPHHIFVNQDFKVIGAND